MFPGPLLRKGTAEGRPSRPLLVGRCLTLDCVPALPTLGAWTSRAAPRAFVRVAGPDAEDYLQRMLSNDVAALEPGESCEALLLTPKARVIAPMRVLRRGERRLPPPHRAGARRDAPRPARAHALRGQGGDRARGAHVDGRLRPRPGGDPDRGLRRAGGRGARRRAASRPSTRTRSRRCGSRRGRRACGKEIDDRVLPAEAGLVERAVSLTKGCYPGQEPIARLHYRGHANRGAARARASRARSCRAATPSFTYGEKAVGRVTSAARRTGASSRSPTSASRSRRTPSSTLGPSNARPLH